MEWEWPLYRVIHNVSQQPGYVQINVPGRDIMTGDIEGVMRLTRAPLARASVARFTILL